jgi:hypothetical protein
MEGGGLCDDGMLHDMGLGECGVLRRCLSCMFIFLLWDVITKTSVGS